MVKWKGRRQSRNIEHAKPSGLTMSEALGALEMQGWQASRKFYSPKVQAEIAKSRRDDLLRTKTGREFFQSELQALSKLADLRAKKAASSKYISTRRARKSAIAATEKSDVFLEAQFMGDMSTAFSTLTAPLAKNRPASDFKPYMPPPPLETTPSPDEFSAGFEQAAGGKKSNDYKKETASLAQRVGAAYQKTRGVSATIKPAAETPKSKSSPRSDEKQTGKVKYHRNGKVYYRARPGKGK